MRGEVDVVLCVAQEGEQRHFEPFDEGAQPVDRDRALASAHADDRDLQAVAALVGKQLADEFVGRVDVEAARLQGH